MRAETVTLPAFLASALINGDLSGLSDGPTWVKPNAPDFSNAVQRKEAV